MEIDPIVVALAGTVTTLAGVLYRALLKRAERAERAEEFWMRRALGQSELARMGVQEAEKREAR